MDTTDKSRLTSTQVEHFKNEGYVLFDEPVFPQEKFEKLRSHFEQKLERLPEDFRPELMDVPHLSDPVLFEWLLADEVLDLVEPLIGPDIALWSSHFISKPQGDGKRVPWHEDSAYWKGAIEPVQVVTVWLAIDPSSPENGCMYVIPRTHDNGFSDYEIVDPEKNIFGGRQVKASQMDGSKAVPCILNANQASLHDGKLIHGSPANTSPLRRCGYTMRYMPTSVKFDHVKRNDHQIYLARGRDLAGNKYADPTKAYPELARYRELHKRGGH